MKGNFLRKGLSIALISCIAVGMLCGCGDSEKKEQASNTAGDSVIDSNEEPYEVVMEVLTLGQDYTDLEAIEEAVNELSVPAINCTIKLKTIHIADHATKLSLAAAGGDKMDLVYTGLTTALSTLVSDGVLVPLSDIAQTHAADLLEKEGDLIEAGKIDGELYSFPANLYPASAFAIIYNQELADQYGITMPESINSFSELEPVAEKLKENGIYLVTMGDGGSGQVGDIVDETKFNTFGGDYGYGALVGSDSTEVVNFYKTDEFKAWCQLMKDWNDKGYTPSDSLTSGENAQDVFRAGKTFCQTIAYAPTENASNQKNYPFETGFCVSSNAAITTTGANQYAWGVCTTSEQPERALDMLNFLYTNSEAANLLMFGLEGKEYEKVSDNIVQVPESVDFSNIGYATTFLRVGDSMDLYQWTPNTEDVYSEIKDFNENTDFGKTFGYTFDTTEVSTEIASVTNVVAEYRPSLLTGNVDDVEAALAIFNEKLEEAGINKIIEENQRQLDEWLAQQ